MLSTRLTLSVIAMGLLLLQLTHASSINHLWKRHPDPFSDSEDNEVSLHGKRGRGRDRGWNVPDTNAEKTINHGYRPEKNVCKKWFEIRDYILRDVFKGTCSGEARASVRLAFHDAGTYSLQLEHRGLPNGGADGSMLSDNAEILRHENRGLERIVALLKPLPERFGVSSGDLLHVASILGVIICPGGPPIETWIGRKESRRPAPTGLLPDIHDPVPKMLGRFEDMGFNIRDTMALVGAHSTSRQRIVDPSQAGKSQDSTPDVWDVKFYSETRNRTIPDGVFKIQSDVAFSQHTLSKRQFAHYIDNQQDWDRDYAKAHEKMSLLGQDRRRMTRCTEILPPKIDLEPLCAVEDSASEEDDGGPVIDRSKLEKTLEKLRGFWGWKGFKYLDIAADT